MGSQWSETTVGVMWSFFFTLATIVQHCIAHIETYLVVFQDVHTRESWSSQFLSLQMSEQEKLHPSHPKMIWFCQCCEFPTMLFYGLHWYVPPYSCLIKYHTKIRCSTGCLNYNITNVKGLARLWLIQNWMLKTPLYWIVATNFKCSQISLIDI